MIYLGSFVWIHDPESVGLTGGVPMTEEGAKNDPLGWSDKDYVFGVAVMHQVHCVVSILLILPFRASSQMIGCHKTRH